MAHVPLGGTCLHVTPGWHMYACPFGGTRLHFPLGGTCVHVPLSGTCLHVPLGGTCLHVPLGGTCLLVSLAGTCLHDVLFITLRLTTVLYSRKIHEYCQIKAKSTSIHMINAYEYPCQCTLVQPQTVRPPKGTSSGDNQKNLSAGLMGWLERISKIGFVTL